MLSFLKGSTNENEAANGGSKQARRVHEALLEGLNVSEAFAAHTAQITDELKRIQKQRQAEREQGAKERQQIDAAWLQRVRCARLETAVRAGLHANDQRGLSRMLRQWSEAAGVLRRESLDQRQSREGSLQLRLRDSGRAELVQERESLVRQVSASALAAQQLRAKLSERSLELERTIVRDTMAFELQAADALRTKQALEEGMKQQAEREAALADEVRALKAQLEAAKHSSAARQAQAEAATAVAMGGEVANMEFALRVRAANQAIVVRCAAQHSAIHRCWRVWASVASLLLREAGGALLQLELAKQQQRGVHTRLQAELAAEVAVARVENIEARTLLAKAQTLEQLRVGHELATDKEMLREQSRALQAAHESAAAAHLAAAAHRVGEQSLARDLRDAEGMVGELAAAALHSRSPMRGGGGGGGGGGGNSRQAEEQMAAERAEMREYMQQQEEIKKGVLRRAGVELRVLVKTVQALEFETANANAVAAAAYSNAPSAGKPKPEGRASPADKSPGPKPRATSPRPAAGGRPPKAPGRGRGR